MSLGLRLNLLTSTSKAAVNSGGSYVALPASQTHAFISAIPTGYSFSRGGGTATYSANSASKNTLTMAAANVPRFEYAGTSAKGLKIEPYHQNFNTNYNFNPTSITGVTAGGAAVASVVADPANYLTNAIYYYGNPIDLKTGVCTNGNVFKVDNSANSVADYVEVAGQIPNVGAISLSLYAVAVGAASTLSEPV